MVLVDKALRGRGIGRALMEAALTFLDGAGVQAIRLDATPLGQPLYEKLGFVVEYRLTRYAGQALHGKAPNGVCATRPEHLDALIHLDRAVTSTDRERLLRRLFEEYPHEARVVESAEGIAGYLLARPGARAWFIGPCIGRATAGPRLLADAWQRHAGEPVFIDIPDENSAARRCARDAGLTSQRELTRMYRGAKIVERIADLWASSGPEKG